MADPTLEMVKDGFAVSDIAAVVITTSDKSYLVQTGTEANFRAAVSAGVEKELRKKDTILAVNKTQDLPKGYDVDLTDLLVHPEVLALIEGGVATFSENKFASFSGPVSGSPVVRTAFRLDVYCENLDTDGSADGYTKFSFPGCKGKPTEFTLRDGDFFTPKYTVESRPAKGAAPITITNENTLPAVT